MSEEEYEQLARAIVGEHESMVTALRTKPKASKINFLVGQMIRRGEKGRIEAPRAEAAIRRLIDLDRSGP